MANTPLQFTAQDDLPHGTAYEMYIHQTAKIPTRDNLHDWFGACVWSVFPKTKSMLNAKHIAHFAHQNTSNGRNRVRDTITVFDENGAILWSAKTPLALRLVMPWWHLIGKIVW